jgi:hypothetical protein
MLEKPIGATDFLQRCFHRACRDADAGRTFACHPTSDVFGVTNYVSTFKSTEKLLRD